MPRVARRRSRARPGRATPIPTTTSRSTGSRRAPGSIARRRPGPTRRRDARARHLRLAAQRRHLPRRDLEDVSPRRARQRRAEPGQGRGRLPRPQPAHLGVRQEDPPVQGLRLDGDAALPLAVQLLSEPFAQPGPRLDERDLRALGRGARDRHRHADALVQHLERAQADDRPAGLRRRRQPRSDLDARQEGRPKRRRSS